MPRVPIVILKWETDYASSPSLYILVKELKNLFHCIGRLGTIPFHPHKEYHLQKNIKNIYMLNVLSKYGIPIFSNLG